MNLRYGTFLSDVLMQTGWFGVFFYMAWYPLHNEPPSTPGSPGEAGVTAVHQQLLDSQQSSSPLLTNSLSSKGEQIYINGMSGTSYLGSTWSDKGSCMSE